MIEMGLLLTACRNATRATFCDLPIGEHCNSQHAGKPAVCLPFAKEYAVSDRYMILSFSFGL